MCDQTGQPASVAEALAMLDRALDHLNAAGAASLPSAVQAEALRVLERAEAKHTAARAQILSAFAGQAAYESDGQGSARTWLRWQTRITTGAAAGAIGWARRVAAHPVIGQAMAAGDLSASWARQICAWTDKLPLTQQGDADEILVGAARGGVNLDGLAGLAQEMYERSRQDGPDADDRFGERYLRLGLTFRGAGRAEGDLTPGCAAALDTVLASLGKKAGPEDRRTADQRRHDALEEACQRLIKGGMLPGRTRQPAHVNLHMTLSQLRNAPGASEVEAAWAAARASQPGWLTDAEADAAACDARLAPVVTGHIDWAALDRMTALYLATHDLPAHGLSTGEAAGAAAPGSGSPGRGQPGQDPPPSHPGIGDRRPPADLATGRSGPVPGIGPPPGTQAAGPPGAPATEPGQHPAVPARLAACGCTCGRCSCLVRTPLAPATLARLRQTMLRLAAEVMSGPTGLAAVLRTTQCTGPEAARSSPLQIPIPLDTGQATSTIPANLVRAVCTRHRHCAFPGCRRPSRDCDIHHLIARSRGGPTALWNMVPLCEFHHLTVIHRWGWTLRLNPDGSITATGPHGHTIHDHSPPRQDPPRQAAYAKAH